MFLRGDNRISSASSKPRSSEPRAKASDAIILLHKLLQLPPQHGGRWASLDGTPPSLNPPPPSHPRHRSIAVSFLGSFQSHGRPVHGFSRETGPAFTQCTANLPCGWWPQRPLETLLGREKPDSRARFIGKNSFWWRGEAVKWGLWESHPGFKHPRPSFLAPCQHPPLVEASGTQQGCWACSWQQRPHLQCATRGPGPTAEKLACQ